MSVASDGNRAGGERVAVSCGEPPAASAGGSGPRTGRPRASSGERRAAQRRRRPARASRWRARSLRRPQPRGCRLQRAPFPASAAANGRSPPDGRHGVPDAAKTTSVGERASVSNPVRSKSSWIVVPRRRPRARNRAAVSRSGAAGAARARCTASSGPHASEIECTSLTSNCGSASSRARIRARPAG